MTRAAADVAADDDFSYWLVWPTCGAQHPEAEGFRTWLAGRAAAEEHPSRFPNCALRHDLSSLPFREGVSAARSAS
jgi:hypothetical protein